MLKKAASIVLLGIILFNWYGYQMLASYLELRANQRLNKLVDINSFQISELILIKVPAEHLGYFVNSFNFERVLGNIEIAGTEYNYVKRRLFNDSLELLCIPNRPATALKATTSEINNLLNGLTGQNKKSESDKGFSKKPWNDNYATVDPIKIRELGFRIVHLEYNCLSMFLDPDLFKIDPPPELEV